MSRTILNFFLLFCLLINSGQRVAAAEIHKLSGEKTGYFKPEQPSFSVVGTYFNRFLHQGTTLSILHTTSKGLWASNYDGVFEAKGMHVTYHNRHSGSGRLRIIKLLEIWQGEVLALTESNSVLVFDEKTGLFKPPAWMQNFGIHNSDISAVHFSSDNSLWIGFTHGDVVKIAKNGTTKEVFPTHLEESITDIFESTQTNEVLISSRTKISKAAISSDNMATFDLQNLCKMSAPVRGAIQPSPGIIWAGTFGEGLFSIDTKSGECSQVTTSSGLQKDFSRSNIHDMKIHEDSGLLIIGTDQGIYIFRNEDLLKHFTSSNSHLSNNEVVSLSPDHSGGYWIGTYSGINRLVISSFEIFNRRSNKDLHSVADIESIGEKRLLIASYPSLLVADNSTGEITGFTPPLTGISPTGDRINTIFVDGENIYLGYRNSGVEVIKLADIGSSVFTSNPLPGLRSGSISAFLKLASDEVLIGTYGGGLAVLEKSGKTVDVSSRIKNSHLLDDRVLMLFRTLDGRVWIGSESGLMIYDVDSGELSTPKFSPGSHENPVQPVIWSMTEDSRYIWFGTMHHGLLRLDKAIEDGQPYHQEIRKVNLDLPPSGLTVYAIEAGSNGDIWFSTSHGISRLANDNSLVHFGQAHGFQEIDFEPGSSHKDAEGFIYFGGTHGYVRFQPEAINIVTPPPDVVLTRMIVGNKATNSPKLNSNLDTIILNHQDRFITFEFSALDFTDPENTRYRHKLTGFDTDWIDIGNRGSATYTSLPPGDYVFRVQAVNSSGVWNYTGLSMNLTVKAAPWFTLWAFAAYFVAFCCVVAVGLKIHKGRTLKNQQLKQADELRQVADRYADSLLDQLEFQRKFTESIHSYNKQLLHWAKFCTDTTMEWAPAGGDLAHRRIQLRLQVLELIQDSLYYRGEQLYSNLTAYTARLVDLVGASHPQVFSRLTTVNDIPDELFPALQGIPLAIIMAELFDNTLTHGFTEYSPACFVRFSVTITADPEAGSDRVKLVYQDSGSGIPEGLGFNARETAGFTIMGHAAEALGCELAIVDKDRNMVTAEFSVPGPEAETIPRQLGHSGYLP